MDAVGIDVEETKGENTRGSGYWEAPRKTSDETGAEGWASRAELDELRRDCTRTFARDCPPRSPSTLATARTRASLSGKS